MLFEKDQITVSSSDKLCVIGCGNGKLDGDEISIIDHLVIYDFNPSTIGGFATLSENYDIEYIYIPDNVPKSSEYESFMEMCYQEDSMLVYVEGSMSFAVGDGSVTVSAGNSASYENTNDFSLMTTVSLGEKRMLHCGSANKERISEFVEMEGRTYSHIVLNEAQKGNHDLLLEKLLPESVIFTDCESYVEGYDVYDIAKGPIIYEG